MNIKKGDILFRYGWYDITDKDYCTEELEQGRDGKCKDVSGAECHNYVKCFFRPQKIILTKVTITTKTYWKHDGSIRHFNAVDLKYWKKPVGNFSNSGFKLNVKIRLSEIDEWSKSESGALRKVLQRLKAQILLIKKPKNDYFARKKRELKNLISLQERIESKISSKS